MRTHPEAIADLHIHTKESDGIKSPHKIILAAKNSKLKTLALTDHHTTRGYDKVAAVAEWYGINLIPGVEISTAEYKSLHILGYGMTDRHQLDNLLVQNSTNNAIQLLRIIDKLREQGIELGHEFIDSMIENKSISRSTIAKELAYLGYAKNKKDAYNNFVGPDGSANVDTYKLTAKEAIESITRAGGVAALAHPRSIRHRSTKEKIQKDEAEALLSDLVGFGLRGIECLPSARKEEDKKSKFLISMANNFHLLPVGGSDYHGDKTDCDEFLGNPHVHQEHIDALLSEIKTANEQAAVNK